MMEVSIAYYRKEDWDRFLTIIDDADNMHDTWAEWYQAFLKLKSELISQGMKVREVQINLEDLIIYCKLNGIRNDGSARSRFVQME